MMDSKEVFDKIETCLTKALNEEDGIMLEGKQIKFKQMTNSMENWAKDYNAAQDPKCVKVCILDCSENMGMWHIAVLGIAYMEAAAIYAVKELKKEFEKNGALVSRNYEIELREGFAIAMTFPEGAIK